MLNDASRPWNATGDVRRAAVSSFGFGGTNFHAVARAGAAARFGAVHWSAELFAFRGDAGAVTRTMQDLKAFICASWPAPALRDLAFTAWSKGEGPVRCAFTAASIDELLERLDIALGGGSDRAIHWRSQEPVGKVAWLFPGQGSQYVGMLRELFVYFPHLAEDLGDNADLAAAIFAPRAYDEAQRERQLQSLTDTKIAQPALALVETALARWLAQLGLKPDMAAGHSFGELAALAHAGRLSPQAAVDLARKRALAILASIQGDCGAMAAVAASAQSLSDLLSRQPGVVVANENSPRQVVISGPSAAVASIVAALKDQGIAAKALTTACAFHSSLVAKAADLFAKDLEAVAFEPASWPVYSNVTAKAHADDPDALRTLLAQHVAKPVRFADEIAQMHADGARVFVEVGPRRVLTGLVGQILDGQPHQAIALDNTEAGLAQLLGQVAHLAVAMDGFDAGALFEGRARTLDLTCPARPSATTWLVNGGSARPLNGPAPSHAEAPYTGPLQQLWSPQYRDDMTRPASGEDALLAYLTNMRETVRAQRDVMLQAFGAGAAIAPPAMTLDPVRAPARASAAGAASPVSPALQITAQPAPTPAAPSASGSPQDAAQALLSVVSERTGYPEAMLDLDLDLEADLSIDSIKRQEIVAELSRRLQLASGASGAMERLARERTLRAMLGALDLVIVEPKAPAAAAAMSLDGPVAGAPVSALPIGERLLEVVAERTGYPVEVLEPELDLEADLSIDSIKRQEIGAAMSSRLGLSDAGERDALSKGLSSRRNLRDIRQWLEERYAGTSAAQTPPQARTQEPHKASAALSRYEFVRAQLPLDQDQVSLSGERWLITNDGAGVAQALAARLGRLGAQAQVIDLPSGGPDAAFDEIDGLLHLTPLGDRGGDGDLQRFFPYARQASLARARHVFTVAATSGEDGHPDPRGYQGFIKTLVLDLPKLRGRHIELDAGSSVQERAAQIEAELLSAQSVRCVTYRDGVRLADKFAPYRGPFEDAGDLGLGSDSVVLITGGLRGVTAGLALDLARRTGCRLELVGRSALPSHDEDAATRGVDDPRQLRRILLEQSPGISLSQVEQQASRIKLEREIRTNLAKLRTLGVEVNYTPLDVSDQQRLGAFIDNLYAKHGRLDGVIHGAGVIEDKHIENKTPEAFGRVFDTKINAAHTLRQKVRSDVKLVIFFSSISAIFGSRGQIDYSAANDALDAIAHEWNQAIDGKVASFNLGPWECGMVDDAVARMFERLNIGLIPLEAGVSLMLDSLGGHKRAREQIMLMNSTLEPFSQLYAPLDVLTL
ncbi:MAG: SDR family NAD(P)-dependent oxidoreductase [Caulobacter sp.]